MIDVGPTSLPDKRVVQCNYVEATRIASVGARAYVVLPNPGNGHDRIQILVRSRSGRWVGKWESLRRLTNFRVKSLPPEHPLYSHPRLEPFYFPDVVVGWLTSASAYAVDAPEK